MPTYEITDPNTGSVIEMEGANPPGEDDIRAAFAQVAPQIKAAREPALDPRVAKSGAALANMAANVIDQGAQAGAGLIPRLNLQQAKRAGNREYDLAAITVAQNYAGSPNQANKDELSTFHREFADSPIGQVFHDAQLGSIVKTGQTRFTPLSQNGAIIPDREASQKAYDALQQGLSGNLSGAVEDIRSAVPQVIQGAGRAFQAAGQELQTAGQFAGPIIAAAFPEVSVPTIIAGAALGEGISQSMEGVQEGREAYDPLNFNLPAIASAALLGPVGTSAPEANLLSRLVQGGQEGLGIAAAVQAPISIQRAEEGQPVFQSGDAQRALQMAAIGAGARALHLPKQKRAQLTPISTGLEESVPIPQISQELTPIISPAEQSAQAFQAQAEQQAVQAAQEQALRQSPQGAEVLRTQLTQQASEAEAAQIAQQRALAEIEADKVSAPLEQENAPQLSPQAQSMYDQYGRTQNNLLVPLGGAAAGGAVGAGIGFTQGDTPQERALNSLKGLGVGAGAGLLAGAGLSRLAQPELNAGEQVLEKASKPPSLANITAETASRVEGSPAGVQAAANQLTQTAQLPTIAQATAKQSALDTIKDKLVAGLKRAGKAISSEPRETLPKFSGDYGAIEEAKPGGPAPIGSYSGVQEGANGEKIDLFHLNQPVYNPDGTMAHPAGSDVTRESLQKLGFTVPEPSSLPLTKSQYAGEMTGEEFNRLRAQEAQAIQHVESVADSLKPLPADTEFLYEQKYNTKSGPKSERYYQVDRTPENPRGRTVDEATLRSEGYDTSELPTVHASTDQGPSQFAGSIGEGGTRGAIDRRTVSTLAGATLGGTLGYVLGDEKSDRVAKSIVGALVGGGLGNKLGADLSAATAQKAALELKVLKNRILNESIPAIATRSEESANSVFKYTNANQAGRDIAKDLQAQILGSSYKDPAYAKKVGSVLVEERLRAIKGEFQNAAKLAKTPEEAAKYAAQADDVVSTIGREDGAFKTESEFQDALQDKDVKASLQRYKETVQPLAEQQHLATGGFADRAEYDAAVQDALKNGKTLPSLKLAAPGPQTGTFANIQALLEDVTPPGVGGGGGKGNLENPLQHRSRFSRQAMGTGEKYDTDLNNIVDRMVRGNYEDFQKRAMFEQLEKDGLGVALPRGEAPPNLENYGQKIPIELKGAGGSQNTNFFPAKSIERELRTALNTDGSLGTKSITARVGEYVNAAQLAGLTDPVIHSTNIIATIASSPGGKTLIGRLTRAMPIAGTVDAVARVFGKMQKIASDSPEIRAQIAKLSSIGGLRQELPDASTKFFTISKLDKAARLVLGDLHQSLVDSNLITDSVKDRRDFSNQIGQYNARLMGHTDKFLKESGLSPFLVAGKNFNRIGLSQVASLVGGSTGGVEASSLGASLQLRAIKAAGAWGTIIAAPALFNYLLWGNVLGPPGTPFGKIAITDPDEKGKRTYFDPSQLTLLRRGLRETGLQAMITGAQTGDNANHTVGAALTDVKNALIHPYAGPLPTFASTAITGSTPTGFRVAPNVTPFGQSSNTLRQMGANLGAAVSNVNPMQGAFLQAANPREGEPVQGPGGSVIPGVANIARSLIGAVGVRSATPLSPDTGELHQTQDVRYETGLNRKKLVDTIITNGVDTNGNIDPSKIRAQLQSPALQQAIRDNPLEAKLLMNEIKTAIKDTAEGRNKQDIAPKFTVAEGERAQYYINHINKLPPDQAQNYLREQAKSGYLTHKVFDQMMFIKSQPATGSR